MSITWRPISLLFKNEPPEGSEYHDATLTTHRMLRVLEAVRSAAASAAEGNQDVFALYWEFGARIHHDGELDVDIADALSTVGLDPTHADAAADESWDVAIRTAMDDGLGLVGTDVGTPIIATTNSRGERAGYFGPVITEIPPSRDSLRMWDALMTMMDIDGFFELKKTRTDSPNPGARPARRQASGAGDSSGGDSSAGSVARMA